MWIWNSIIIIFLNQSLFSLAVHPILNVWHICTFLHFCFSVLEIFKTAECRFCFRSLSNSINRIKYFCELKPLKHKQNINYNFNEIIDGYNTKFNYFYNWSFCKKTVSEKSFPFKFIIWLLFLGLSRKVRLRCHLWNMRACGSKALTWGKGLLFKIVLLERNRQMNI